MRLQVLISSRVRRGVLKSYWCAALFLFQTGALLFAQPAPPAVLNVTGYDSHIELTWPASSSPNIIAYNIYRAEPASGNFQLFSQTAPNRLFLLDFTGRADTSFIYRITALNSGGQESMPTAAQTGTTAAMSDDDLLTMVQRYTFRYFWEFGHPVSGLARERNSSGDIVTTGGSGFGIMAIPVAIERGFITRQEGLLRLIQITSFLEVRAERFHGAFSHWLNGNTGATIPFSQFDNGGDLVETAFLMQGLLTVRAYFNEDTPLEGALRASVTRLWEDVEWDWYRRNNSNVLYWHWSPNHQWTMNLSLRGFNEVMIAYILGIASPTHSIPASLYHTGWAGSSAYVNTESYYGIPMLVGPFRGGPLFFAHYSYMSFDPRNKRDAYCNYFTRNRNHTLINRAYCIANPKGYAGYGPNSWGLTASDNPFGYLAHEPVFNRDNGTITPTAALSSMPYTPAESMDALKHFYRNLGGRLWGYYGFYDAFNLHEDWFADSYLAIDQGPIIGMIENHRTGLLWNLFMANPEIQPALDAIGFVPDVSAAGESASFLLGANAHPNPTQSEFTLTLDMPQALPIEIYLMDVAGKPVRNFGVFFLQAGKNVLPLQTAGLSRGLYYLVCHSGSRHHTLKIVVFHN